MGYFSNGTEGDIYQERYCRRCIHDDGCPVWDAHLLYNGDQEQEPVLDLLIPRKGVFNGACLMFSQKGGGGGGGERKAA